jgi:hypothetical protein
VDGSKSGTAVAGLILPTFWPVLPLLLCESAMVVLLLMLLALPSNWWLVLPSALLRISSMPCCVCVAGGNGSGSAVAGLILPTC